jgi:hypothetical protein
MSFEHRGLLRPSQSRPSLDRADREQKRAVLQLSDGLVIEGLIHIPPGTRPLDFFNRPTDSFIAVTNAVVYAGGQSERTPFIAVNKAHIISVRDA